MDEKTLIEFLLSGSRVALKDAFLRGMAEERNKRKEIGDLLESWAEERAQLIALEFFLMHGEELAARLVAAPAEATLPAQPFALPKRAPLPKRPPRNWRRLRA